MESLAKNCLEIKNEKECKTCPEGYVFVTYPDTEVTQCEAFQIDNCEHIDSTSKKCTLCEPDYYVNNLFKCSQVPFFIKDCLYYETKDMCSQCKVGFLLTLNKKSCLKKGENHQNPMNDCKNIIFEETQECVACAEGYYFADGECVACNYTLDQGCYACNYENSNECLICSS
jgi:hypothetical protein